MLSSLAVGPLTVGRRVSEYRPRMGAGAVGGGCCGGGLLARDLATSGRAAEPRLVPLPSFLLVLLALAASLALSDRQRRG